MRELVWTSRQRGRHDWNQTALLASILINANRDPKKQKRAVEPDQLNPYADRKAARRGGLKICKENRGILKKLLPKKK